MLRCTSPFRHTRLAFVFATLVVAGCSPRSDNVPLDSTVASARNDSIDPTRARGLHSDSSQGRAQGLGVLDESADQLQGLTDTSIASIIFMVDRAEVAEGKLALQRAADPKVKRFARDMISAHERHQRTISAIIASSSLGMADTASRTSPAASGTDPVAVLRAKQATTLETLRGATGAAFDRLFIDAMVAGHEEFLGVLKRAAPSAEPLKKDVETLQPVVSDHLQRAKSLQETLAARAATSS